MRPQQWYMWICFVILGLPPNVQAARQFIGIKGRLLCQGSPMPAVFLQLVDIDDFNRNDLISLGRTDHRGNFHLHGSASDAASNIDPELRIYHTCGAHCPSNKLQFIGRTIEKHHIGSTVVLSADIELQPTTLRQPCVDIPSGAEQRTTDRVHGVHRDTSVRIPTAATVILTNHAPGYANVRGSFFFHQARPDIPTRVAGHVQGLSPGLHGYHIHELSLSDGCNSSGFHFNPDNMEHGGPSFNQRHAGDFGNLEVPENGTVKVSFENDRIALSGRRSIIGRTLVIHADNDKFQTKNRDPDGAGLRIACGVVEALHT